MLIKEPNAILLINDVLKGANVTKSSKYYRDAQNYYESIDHTIELDTIMYDVYRTINETVGAKQDMIWGLTVLYPRLVNGECNMTRGHFHKDDQRSEVYYGVSGEGLLLLMDKQGNTWAEKVFPGSVHLIDGQHAHRLINITDNEALKVIACWSMHAGYDYQFVEDHPFGNRIFLKDHQIIVK